MSEARDLTAEARAIIAANLYLVLGTADGSGSPWTTPVYFSPGRPGDFYWISSPESRHSVNIAARPEVSLAIFDSQAPIGGASAVYARAMASQVPGPELEHCAEIFCSRVPEVRGFGPDQLRAPQPLRLYRGRATELSILVRGRDPLHESEVDVRVLVDLGT